MNKRFTVEGKKIDVAEYDWDVLIILDACRYDMFKEVYKDIIGNLGALKKAISPATWTPDFLDKTFSDKYLGDVIYLSSNPYVNSMDIQPPRHGGHRFNAKKHFKKIVDVWKTGWDDKLRTVPPDEMNKKALVLMDLHKKKRFIVHYMQPHEPCIYFGGGLGWDKPTETKRFNPLQKFSDFGNIILSQEKMWTIADKLGMTLPAGGKGRLWLEHGREGLRKGYKEDIKLVLKHVKVLIEKFKNKKFLVIADHGERLGERGNYGHTINRKEKCIVEVPWFETKEI